MTEYKEYSWIARFLEFHDEFDSKNACFAAIIVLRKGSSLYNPFSLSLNIEKPRTFVPSTNLKIITKHFNELNLFGDMTQTAVHVIDSIIAQLEFHRHQVLFRLPIEDDKTGTDSIHSPLYTVDFPLQRELIIVFLAIFTTSRFEKTLNSFHTGELPTTFCVTLYPLFTQVNPGRSPVSSDVQSGTEAVQLSSGQQARARSGGGEAEGGERGQISRFQRMEMNRIVGDTILTKCGAAEAKVAVPHPRPKRLDLNLWIVYSLDMLRTANCELRLRLDQQSLRDKRQTEEDNDLQDERQNQTAMKTQKIGNSLKECENGFFLNGDLEKNIYMNQPEGFIAPGQEGKITKDMLKSKFDMKDMGLADVILGITIIRTHNGLVLSQAHYRDKILNTQTAGNSGQARTPMTPVCIYLKIRGLELTQIRVFKNYWHVNVFDDRQTYGFNRFRMKSSKHKDSKMKLKAIFSNDSRSRRSTYVREKWGPSRQGNCRGRQIQRALQNQASAHDHGGNTGPN
ncbi:zinc finger, CCHC-type containing protein [Tanacetum coccineum]